ncbi:DUF3000 domain-containing protein [Micrococcoides hystricis]|uniref:DUF3000 domain-containing protein n=1 Tax=Micrococcoides hystricis TaxID=1572761 RepID=A0ABV6P6Y7_9MICC
MSVHHDSSAVPAVFRDALGQLRTAHGSPQVRLVEIPAPQGLAPYAIALEAEIDATQNAPSPENVTDLYPESGTPLRAHGRFVLLYDPAGSPVWDGQFRIVTFIRTTTDAEMSFDPLLGQVAWSWLVEALESNGCHYRAAGAAATRVLAEHFGTLADRPDQTDLEVRASWTPEENFGAHLQAWTAMLCAFAGVPELPDGVTALPFIRRN